MNNLETKVHDTRSFDEQRKLLMLLGSLFLGLLATALMQ